MHGRVGGIAVAVAEGGGERVHEERGLGIREADAIAQWIIGDRAEGVGETGKGSGRAGGDGGDGEESHDGLV